MADEAQLLRQAQSFERRGFARLNNAACLNRLRFNAENYKYWMADELFVDAIWFYGKAAEVYKTLGMKEDAERCESMLESHALSIDPLSIEISS